MKWLAGLLAMLLWTAAGASDRQESRFQTVFDGILKGANSGPPYHRLEPQDLQVQSLGADSAVVTFHLRNSERIARRTLVMKKVQGTWLIAHLHASNFQTPAAR
jgi:hypothetical protein